jgi:TolB protein
MMMAMRVLCCALLLASGVPLGVFDGHGDIGAVLHAGAAEYDPAAKNYTITGSGENMWFGADQFQYVWKKVSGDVSLCAAVSILSETGDPHRKAALMIRQSLEPDSAYADAALHGEGLTSLQYREEKGADTHGVQSGTSGPKRLRLEKRGDTFYLWVAGAGEDWRFSGGSARVPMKDPFYVGLAVCAHEKDAGGRRRSRT